MAHDLKFLDICINHQKKEIPGWCLNHERKESLWPERKRRPYSPSLGGDPLPTQPENARDVAMVVDEGVTWGEIEKFAAAHREPLRDAAEPPRF